MEDRSILIFPDYVNRLAADQKEITQEVRDKIYGFDLDTYKRLLTTHLHSLRKQLDDIESKDKELHKGRIQSVSDVLDSLPASLQRLAAMKEAIASDGVPK